MKKTQLRRLLSFILCIVLIAATALFTIGCSDNEGMQNPQDANDLTGAADSSAVVFEEDGSTIGEGDTEFKFTVVYPDGNEVSCTVCTDKETVGDALLELGIIAGEDSEYGLFVKTVNGLTVDYDTDGRYWAFYENDKYAVSGIDTTEIAEETVYSFRAEK